MSARRGAAWTSDGLSSREAVEELFAAIECSPGVDIPVLEGFLALRLVIGLPEDLEEDTTQTHLAHGVTGLKGKGLFELEDATFLFRNNEGVPFIRVAVSNGFVTNTWPLLDPTTGEPFEEGDDV